MTEPENMATVILQWKSPSRTALAKANEIAMKREGRLTADRNDGSDTTPPTKKNGAKVHPGFDEISDEHVDDKAAAAYCWRKWKDAVKIDDLVSASYWHDHYLKTTKAIRDDELHARKMGLDEGQIINRETFEAWVHAWAFWAVRSVEVDLKELPPKLLNLAYVEEAWGVLDRFFLRKRFLAPFAKSVTAEGGVALPRWAIDCLRSAVDAYFEIDPSDTEDRTAYQVYQAALKEREAS